MSDSAPSSTPEAPPVVAADADRGRRKSSFADLAPGERKAAAQKGYLASVEQGKLTGRPPHEEIIWQSRAEDVARRILLNRSVAQIGRELGISSVSVRAIIDRVEFAAIFDRIRTEMYRTIDETIADERADTMLRRDALYERGMTLAGEIMEAVRKHIKDAPVPRAAVLKAGVDAVAQVRMFKDEAPQSTPGRATFNLNVTADKAAIIQATMIESGVDLSDILEDYKESAVDAEVVHES